MQLHCVQMASKPILPKPEIMNLFVQCLLPFFCYFPQSRSVDDSVLLVAFFFFILFHLTQHACIHGKNKWKLRWLLLVLGLVERKTLGRVNISDGITTAACSTAWALSIEQSTTQPHSHQSYHIHIITLNMCTVLLSRLHNLTSCRDSCCPISTVVLVLRRRIIVFFMFFLHKLDFCATFPHTAFRVRRGNGH